MNRKSIVLLLLLTLVSSGPPASEAIQREDPDAAKNLKYFPKNTPRSEIIAQMREFSFALGVACTHCHGTEEQTGFDLAGVDFSLDLKPAKETAREMLRMVDEINSGLLSKVSRRSDLNLDVSCFTCHSGIPLPERIESRVLRKIDNDGLQSALKDYRSLRRDYHGSAAYNFKEQPLVEVASALQRSEKHGAAAAICQMNLEFHPGSVQSKFRLAEAFAESGETEQARKIYRELLKSRRGDRRLKQRLRDLDEKEK